MTPTTRQLIRQRASRISVLEDQLDERRRELHIVMRRARTEGHLDVTIARDAGLTKQRVAQILGAKRPQS